MKGKRRVRVNLVTTFDYQEHELQGTDIDAKVADAISKSRSRFEQMLERKHVRVLLEPKVTIV